MIVIDVSDDNFAVVTTFELTGTSSWTEWSTETHVLSLAQGVHKFHVVASNSTGSNIDWISIQENIDAEEEIGEASEEQVLERVLSLTPTGSPQCTQNLPGVPRICCN